MPEGGSGVPGLCRMDWLTGKVVVPICKADYPPDPVYFRKCD